MAEQITYERLRDLYSWMTGWRADVPAGRNDLQRLQDTQRAEFDAVMAAHDAQVRVEALRDAVQRFEDEVGKGDLRRESERDGSRWMDAEEAWEHQGPFMDWLRNEADRIADTNHTDGDRA